MEKPKVTGVQHVGLGVRDIEASRKFYRDVLECKIPMADFGVTHNGFHMLELYEVSKPRGRSIPFHVAGRGPASTRPRRSRLWARADACAGPAKAGRQSTTRLDSDMRLRNLLLTEHLNAGSC
jgi:catechol 2,3-dioxygenase-like lactoylglutathione lyase family enzyme